MRGKKLTQKEREERVINKILKTIRNIERYHNQHFITSACYKYINSNREKKKAQEDLLDAEKRLKEAKAKLGR